MWLIICKIWWAYWSTAYIFSSSGTTCKSHLMKVLSNIIAETLLRHCKDPEKPNVFSLGATGISALNIDVTTISSGLRIKPGTNWFGLNDISKSVSEERF